MGQCCTAPRRPDRTDEEIATTKCGTPEAPNRSPLGVSAMVARKSSSSRSSSPLGGSRSTHYYNGQPSSAARSRSPAGGATRVRGRPRLNDIVLNFIVSELPRFPSIDGVSDESLLLMASRTSIGDQSPRRSGLLLKKSASGTVPIVITSSRLHTAPSFSSQAMLLSTVNGAAAGSNDLVPEPGKLSMAAVLDGNTCLASDSVRSASSTCVHEGKPVDGGASDDSTKGTCGLLRIPELPHENSMSFADAHESRTMVPSSPF